MEKPRGPLAVFLPAVDPAPMHDHRRLGDARRNLQVADERLAFERDLDDRKRRLVVLRRLAEQTQRMLIGLLLARRAGDGVATDMAIFEGEGVELGKLLAGGPCLGARVGLRLVSQTDLAPRRRPVVAIEAEERIDHLLGIVAADTLERIDVAGATHDLLLDLVERALLCGCIGHPKRKRCGDAASDEPRCVHVGPLPKDVIRRPCHSGVGLACVIRAPYPTGRDFERSELKRAFCSSVSPS